MRIIDYLLYIVDPLELSLVHNYDLIEDFRLIDGLEFNAHLHVVGWIPKEIFAEPPPLEKKLVRSCLLNPKLDIKPLPKLLKDASLGYERIFPVVIRTLMLVRKGGTYSHRNARMERG